MIAERTAVNAFEITEEMQARDMLAQAKAARAAGAGPSFEFRGANAVLQSLFVKEVIVSGPSETGKTISALHYMDSICRRYRNARGAMVRKVRADMAGTVLDIYKKSFVDPVNDIRIFGGENVEFYEYAASGTRVYVGGIDRPGRVLSGSLDFVYFNQAEEAEVEDWETLGTRTTGRGNVIAPHGLLFGDCNPGPPTHWIRTREAAGKLLLLHTTHRDNPALYDRDGNITARGKETISTLSSLTGTLYSRLYLGEWVSASGGVYEGVWSDGPEFGNVTEQAEYVPEVGVVVWGIDDGYSAGSAPHSAGRDPKTGTYVADSHPRVILFIQIKPDGHIDVFDEYYSCLKLSNVHIADALQRNYPAPAWAAHGPGTAEIRGRLFEASIPPRACNARVDESIKELRAALAMDANKWRRVRVHPRCKHLRSEMAAYAYEPGSDKPVKQYDHGPDGLRYPVWLLRFER